MSSDPTINILLTEKEVRMMIHCIEGQKDEGIEKLYDKLQIFIKLNGFDESDVS